MKFSVVSCLGAFLLLTMPSPAKTAPASATSSDGQLLGMIEGVVHFCDHANSRSASSYKLVDQLFTSGQSAKALAHVRNADPYESAFAQIDKQLKALPAQEALAVCNAH
jgi:hypothetical protein